MLPIISELVVLLQKSDKNIVIIIVILALVLLIGVPFVLGLTSGIDAGLNEDMDNITELNNTNNSTYSVDGVSFKCPDNWSVSVLNENGIISIVASPVQIVNESASSQVISTITSTLFGFVTSDVILSYDSPQFEVDISHNNGISEQEAINQVKNDVPVDGKKVSSSTITVDGNKAYNDIFITSSDEDSVAMKFEQICFVKNGKTYLMTFSAAEKDFDKEKKNFNMILNSFKVQ
jgi:hypothetical protein